jgi:cysteine-rich CWC protein
MAADASAASCPVCGQLNACAVAAGVEPVAACWCAAVRIQPEALRRIPAEMRGRACLCPACAAEQRQGMTSPRAAGSAHAEGGVD